MENQELFYQESGKTDPVKAIENLGKGSALRHTKIHVFYLRDEEKQYLTLEKVFIEGQGKGKKNSTIVINNFLISNSQAKIIPDKYVNKRERIEVI